MPEKNGEESARFFRQLMESLHLAFENIGSLGDSAVESGQIWSVELDAAGKPSQPVRITAVNDLAWPVCDAHGRTYAIQNEGVVQITEAGSPTLIDREKQWIKLFGVGENGDVMGIVCEAGENEFATLHRDGKTSLTPAPNTDEGQEYKAILEGESRAYAGQRYLFVERSTVGGRGFDVFFRTGEEVVNLSNCGNDRSGHPSLSPDFRRVLFVRKPAY